MCRYVGVNVGVNAGMGVYGCMRDAAGCWTARCVYHIHNTIYYTPLIQRIATTSYTLLPNPTPPAGLTAAYSTPTPYTKDGLLLLHKYGVYQGGCTPTALLWKDGGCSRFAVDTNADGSIPDAQVCCCVVWVLVCCV